MTGKSSATHDDAQLILRLYELRREDKMREARTWYTSEFLPETVDDVKAVWFDSKHSHNAHFRMVTTYWDMAASFVTQGALNGELLLASSTEMLLVWGKLEEFIEEIRRQSGIVDYLSNIEAVVQLPAAQSRMEWVRQRIDYYRVQRKVASGPSS